MIDTISREAYDASDAVNYSSLKNMRVSAAHYFHRLTVRQKETPTMTRGTSVHMAIFEPSRFLAEHVVFGGERRVGGEWKAFEEKHAHRIIMKQNEMDFCLGLAEAVRTPPIAGPRIARCEGRHEQTVTWTDATSGLSCKARLDTYDDKGLLLDLKQCRSVDGRQFGQQAHAMFWHGQSCFYGEGLIANGVPVAERLIIAVENDPTGPMDVGVFDVGQDALFAASEELRELLAKVKQGRETGVWPGRYAEVQELILPRWAFPEDDDLGLTMEDG